MPPPGIDRQGLTSVLTPPLIAPARVRFKDTRTGQWIEGISEPKIDPNHFRMTLDIKAYSPCPYEGKDRLHRLMRTFHHRGGTLMGWPTVTDGAHCPVCGTARTLVGERHGPANLLVNNYAKLTQVGLFGQTTTVTDTTSNARSVTAAVLGGGITTKAIHAGTGATAATVADIAMQTSTESAAATVNAVAGSGSSGTFTVTATITATADRAYVEVGIVITTTTNAWAFLLSHDSFAVLNVSSSGTLSTTYTLTNS
jgi:hypothetical protein